MQRKQNQYRLDVMSKLGKEYDVEEAEKARRRRLELEDNKRNYSTTLDIKHESHENNYRSYINKLNEQVGYNQENYIKYNSSIPDRVRTYQDICYNPRLSPYSKIGIMNQPNMLSISYDISKKQNYDHNQAIPSTKPQLYNGFNYIKDEYKQTSGNNTLTDSRFNGFQVNENKRPDYQSLYGSDRKIDFGEKMSSLPYNIVAHNNSKHLEELYNKDKHNQITMTKSVLEYNKEAIKLKQATKLNEDQNRHRMIHERMKESEKQKRDAIESNLLKQENQNNYKALLDYQTIPKMNIRYPAENDSFKSYDGQRNFSLANSQTYQNQINSYGFAQDYMKKSYLS